MNTFIKRLMEFADYVGLIGSVYISSPEHGSVSADYASVDGKTRDGKKKFTISVHIQDIEEEEKDGN